MDKAPVSEECKSFSRYVMGGKRRHKNERQLNRKTEQQRSDDRSSEAVG